MAQIIVDKDVTEEIAIHVMTTVAKKYAQRELSKAQCKVEKDRMKDAEVKKIKGEAKAKEGKEKPKKRRKKKRYGRGAEGAGRSPATRGRTTQSEEGKPSHQIEKGEGRSSKGTPEGA